MNAEQTVSRRKRGKITRPVFKHWLQVVKNDKRAIFTAASHAQKAADYLHGLQQDEEDVAARYEVKHKPAVERFIVIDTQNGDLVAAGMSKQQASECVNGRNLRESRLI